MAWPWLVGRPTLAGLGIAVLCALPSALGQIPQLYKVHAFYYLWYGEPSTDGRFQHWDHEVLAHWNKDTAAKYPAGIRFEPPDCLHSPFYPLRGPYSSRSADLIRQHLREMEEHGIGVMVVSWWGPPWREGSHDTQKVNTDERVEQVIREIEASRSKVRVAFHLEPYEGRTKEQVREDLVYLSTKFKDSQAVLRINGRIAYYVYDSYRIPASDWAQLLTRDGPLTVRGTDADGFFIGLWLNKDDGDLQLLPGGFDGFYNYFASEMVSYAADPANWSAMMRWAEKHGLVFIPSIGPGYNDSKIRPWNTPATRARDDGTRYREQWDRVVQLGALMVSITSYNEWGEGTQIEPAVARPATQDCEYIDYEPGGPYLYLDITREGGERLVQMCQAAAEAQE